MGGSVQFGGEFGDAFATEVRARCGPGACVEYLHEVCGRSPAMTFSWVTDYVVETAAVLLPAIRRARGDALDFGLSLLEQRNRVAEFVLDKLETRDRGRDTGALRQELASAKFAVAQLRAGPDTNPEPQ